MKRIIILTAVLTAAILSACASNVQELLIEESITSAGITESNMTETEQVTEPDVSGAAEGTASAAEDVQEKKPPQIQMRFLDYGSINPDDANMSAYSSAVFCGDILCLCNITCDELDVGSPRHELHFYDINENTLVKTVELPGVWNFEKFVKGYGNILCKELVSRRVLDENGEFSGFEYAVATVYDDYTYDISYHTPQSAAFAHYGHKLAETEVDILDADRDAAIVKGYKDENDEFGFKTEYRRYAFPIDENRFVYRTGGYERIPGFGVYDFGTDTARDVPDSENLTPIGAHGGKIYSVQTAWDGFGSKLYVTDIETLGTEFFMDCPIELEGNDVVRYAMPEGGDYLLYLYEPADFGKNEVLYALDLGTGETASADIPEKSDMNFPISFTDDGAAVISNWSGKCLLVSIIF